MNSLDVQNRPNFEGCRVGIFSGSRFPIDTKVKEDLEKALERISEVLDPRHHVVVYGGGASGLMGVLPRYFHEKNGPVLGIDARMFAGKDGTVTPFGEQHVEETFEARQKRLLDSADVFLALPGGVGTLYEILEVLVSNDLKLWKREPSLHRTILVFNHNAGYNGLKEQIEGLVQAGYVVESSAKSVLWCDTADDVCAMLKTCTSEIQLRTGPKKKNK